MDFNQYAAKGNEFLHKLAKNLGEENNVEHAARILRSTLRVLRNNITTQESMQLLAQLPMALKSVYVDGWKMTKIHRRIKTVDDFADEIIRDEGNVAWRDFSNTEEVIQAVHAVINTLALYVSPDELEDAFGTLPKEIKKVFNTWIPA